jgi:Ca-activated chloride channel homolog
MKREGIITRNKGEQNMKSKAWTGLFFTGVFLAVLVFSGIHASGDAVSLHGIVTDGKGNPLPGAEVILTRRSDGRVFTTRTDIDGRYAFTDLAAGVYDLRALLPGFAPAEKKSIQIYAAGGIKANLVMTIRGFQDRPDQEMIMKEGDARGVMGGVARPVAAREISFPVVSPPPFNTEEYARIYENRFLDVLTNPLSTFSIDVDTASYANIRRFIRENRFPPKDAVRVEEVINYFDYEYPVPQGDDPFSIYMEMSQCPWNKSRRLIHAGLQGKTLLPEDQPPSNLVFLLDVSGSMNTPRKLPLLQTAFKLLVKELSEKDRVAIVVYAGAAGLVLPSTSAAEKQKIIDAIEKLEAGGSTAGGAGIRLAYKTAMENLIPQGNNRIILATDGDFNIGVSSTSELVRLIEEKREKGVFLTILGFGTGNYKDNRMEQLADKGNGNYYYIDNLLEAKKVFIDDLRGTLFTIAKDVKIQVEFNPAKIKAYRLLGYENRLLDKEDFADDTKDAGELGAGHSVTALYEVIPYGSEEDIPAVDDLKYQETKISPEAFKSPEAVTIRLRYKKPNGQKSLLIESALNNDVVPEQKTSNMFKFSAAAAEFAMLLRDSEHKGDAGFDGIIQLAKAGLGADPHGYRAEFIKLAELAQLLTKTK